MISEHIRLAVLALVETDKRATDADKEAIVRALTGHATQDRLLSYADAAAILGRSKTTVGRMARTGRRARLWGLGRDGWGSSPRRSSQAERGCADGLEELRHTALRAEGSEVRRRKDDTMPLLRTPDQQERRLLQHCVTEGFKGVYFMTGKRDNGWRWAERRAKYLAENPVRRMRVTEMYVQYPSLIAQRERCATTA